ncbi:MAG: hypothetical protein WC834_02895 [Eubacteriales bacterium]
MKKAFVVVILFVLISLVGCTNQYNSLKSSTNDTVYYKQIYKQLLQEQPPLIKDIRFETVDGKVIKENGGWFELGQKVKIVIVLEGSCTQVDFFVTPTGTQTYTLQKMIGTVTANNNIAEYTWDVPDGTMGHFDIIAYKDNVGRRSGLFNIIHNK